uniref:Uncharacterized protein n=1 Tax=Chromera velia CCMP2878 TaxID=1169474 RepID=A0A0G4HAA9_9ALVE|mmetsp:Transcript_37705/g.74142  ORF Transcript_37705/g.74142 Transcript_37705/m.74142 type:complete len:383 (-) Transcript_37705:490-1638(-)|eukprot:Cvel_25486.t1-p1 / transcript=Cvel_25486.t1 / gene=Cvel_25486 / organism=Chromera_velia_CCMP2878 / gene_product=hypothetical protein / transcript_product=hypothetical protein / location=Cvel_scaffold2895:2014-6013(-) / protein_length=382 / sequence_SO=supercontig / SO=protein_coding / is_pseudo=false
MSLGVFANDLDAPLSPGGFVGHDSSAAGEERQPVIDEHKKFYDMYLSEKREREKLEQKAKNLEAENKNLRRRKKGKGSSSTQERSSSRSSNPNPNSRSRQSTADTEIPVDEQEDDLTKIVVKVGQQVVTFVGKTYEEVRQWLEERGLFRNCCNEPMGFDRDSNLDVSRSPTHHRGRGRRGNDEFLGEGDPFGGFGYSVSYSQHANAEMPLEMLTKTDNCQFDGRVISYRKGEVHGSNLADSAGIQFQAPDQSRFSLVVKSLLPVESSGFMIGIAPVGADLSRPSLEMSAGFFFYPRNLTLFAEDGTIGAPFATETGEIPQMKQGSTIGICYENRQLSILLDGRMIGVADWKQGMSLPDPEAPWCPSILFASFDSELEVIQSG